MEEYITDSPRETGPRTTNPVRISRILIVISLCVVVIFGLNTLRKPKTTENQPTPEVAGISVTPTTEITPQVKDQLITLDEIAKHDQKDDCWFAIENKVYDVTSFISSAKHPGKDAIIQGCGKDATSLYNTRPMGSKTPHSDKARSFLINFQIGILTDTNEE